MVPKLGDLADKLLAFEDGNMSDEDVVKLFQELIDTDMAWNLQGSYGRLADSLIAVGLCHPKE